MASRALGEGPRGFSLDASLMASVTELPGQFFQGLAGLVGGQLSEVRLDDGGDGNTGRHKWGLSAEGQIRRRIQRIYRVEPGGEEKLPETYSASPPSH